MTTNGAQDLFEKLASFKTQEELLEHCKNVLTFVEKGHYDYKQKHDTREPKLHDDDRKNLGKALSGFANCGGGVLIWGIKGTRTTTTPKPIEQAREFEEKLQELFASATDPPVQGVDTKTIPVDEGNTSGFVVLYVPESDRGPHRVILNVKGVQNHYYIRSGSSFNIAQHSTLDDMFGRRPRPKLVLSLTDITAERHGRDIQGIFKLVNEGRGLAKHPVVIVKLFDGLNGRGRDFDTTYSWAFGEYSRVGITNIGDRVIHPKLDLELMGVTFGRSTFQPGADIALECMVGAEGQPLTAVTLEETYPA